MHHIPSQNKLSSFVSEVRKAQEAEYLETAFWRRCCLTRYVKDEDWGIEILFREKIERE